MNSGEPAPQIKPGGAKVLRVHTVSETGHPYEIHHVRTSPPPPLTGSHDPVTAAERALAALAPHFREWLIQDLARLRAALVERTAPDAEARLRRALHDLKGNAATLGRPDLGDEAQACLIDLESGAPQARRRAIALSRSDPTDAQDGVSRESARIG